jgi:tetratricopeptide (TPR) repeat protein
LFLLFILLSGILSSAQQLDSLRKRLPFHKDDTTKVSLLVNIIDAAAYSSPSLVAQYADSLLALSQRIRYEPGVISAYLYLSQFHFLNEEWDAMKAALSKAEIIYKKNDDLDGLFNVKSIYARYYNSIGEQEKALHENFEILKHYEKQKDARAAGLQSRIAQILSSLKRYGEAEIYYLKSLSTRKLSNDKRGMSIVLVNLGAMCNDWKKYDKASVYLNECLKLQKELNDSVIMVACESNLAHVYNRQEKHEQALISAQRSLDYYQSKNDTNNVAIMLMCKSASYARLRDFESSLNQLHLGTVLLANNHHHSLNAELYNNYYEVYKLMGDFEKALEYLEKEVQIKQENSSLQFNDKISELKEKYETEIKEQENVALKNDNEIKNLTLQNQLNTIYTIIVISLMVIIITVLLVRVSRAKAKEKNIRLQQKLFVSQMNPHFIFNSLNVIQNYIYKQDSFSASTYLSQFAELIRMTLNHSRKDTITLDEEIKLLKNYIELQQLRFANKFTYDIYIDEELDTEFVEIPPMLIQPFVENSLEHGLFRNNEYGKITIRFKKDTKHLKVEIEDNGIGIHESIKFKNPLKEHESLATVIAKERIENINKQYKNAAFEIIDLATIDNSLHGVKVIFMLPYISLIN